MALSQVGKDDLADLVPCSTDLVPCSDPLFKRFGKLIDAGSTRFFRHQIRCVLPRSIKELQLSFELITQKTTPTDLRSAGGCSYQTLNKFQCKEYTNGNR